MYDFVFENADPKAFWFESVVTKQLCFDVLQCFDIIIHVLSRIITCLMSYQLLPMRRSKSKNCLRLCEINYWAAIARLSNGVCEKIVAIIYPIYSNNSSLWNNVHWYFTNILFNGYSGYILFNGYSDIRNSQETGTQ